jgi:hypothetical protein
MFEERGQHCLSPAHQKSAIKLLLHFMILWLGGVTVNKSSKKPLEMEFLSLRSKQTNQQLTYDFFASFQNG